MGLYNNTSRPTVTTTSHKCNHMLLPSKGAPTGHKTTPPPGHVSKCHVVSPYFEVSPDNGSYLNLLINNCLIGRQIRDYKTG